MTDPNTNKIVFETILGALKGPSIVTVNRKAIVGVVVWDDWDNCAPPEPLLRLMTAMEDNDQEYTGLEFTKADFMVLDTGEIDPSNWEEIKICPSDITDPSILFDSDKPGDCMVSLQVWKLGGFSGIQPMSRIQFYRE